MLFDNNGTCQIGSLQLAISFGSIKHKHETDVNGLKLLEPV